MAKAASKPTPPIVRFAFLALAVGAIAYLYLDEPAPTPKRTSRPKPKAVAANAAISDVIEADYTAKFPRVTQEVGPAFKPLVFKPVREKGASSAVPRLTNGIPDAFAGGPGWQYTGYVEVNGLPNALVENSETGEGVYLVAGQRWKRATVLTVTRDDIVLAGSGGVARSIPIASLDPVGEVPPVTISGDIGDASVQPLPRPAPSSNDGRSNASN